MKNLKKSHLLLIILSVLFLLGCIGMTAFLLFSNYRNVRLFRQAGNNFLRGDAESLALAENQLLQVINIDDDNESAYIMLGKIARQRKVYPEQVYYCYMAHRLNPLSAENKADYIRSLCFARYFDRLENLLSQQSDLSPEENQLLLYAAGRNGNIEKYKQLTSKCGKQGIANLALLLFKYNHLSASQKLDILKSVPDDAFEKQEFLAAKTELYLEKGDIDLAEKALKDAYELNNYAFAPALGRFYANYKSFKDALAVFEKHLATYHDPAIALQTAEIYCLLGKPDKITELRNQYQSDSGNRAMLFCYYFDAMILFTENKLSGLQELLVPLRSSIRTPLAKFMFFCVDVQGNDLSAVRESYTALISGRSYLDLQSRADSMLLQFLKRQLTANRGREDLLLPLAEQLYSRKKDLFTAKLILFARRKSGSADSTLLKDALQRFPQDQGIIKFAIEYYLRRDAAECDKLVGYYKKKFPARSSDMLRYEIVLAADRRDHELVSRLFRKNFSPATVHEYWKFASSTGRKDDLIFISQNKLYAPFCQALLHIRSGRKDAACDLLEKADAQNNASLLFFAAKTLAENNRNKSALEKYALIPENSPYNLDILLNTSELYAESGNLQKAEELARKANQLAPDLPETQLCYADKLHRSGKLTAIPDVIKLRTHSPFRKRLEQLWTAGMQQKIKDCDLQSQRERARELCRRLLSVSSNNPTAVECLKKLNKMPQ